MADRLTDEQLRRLTGYVHPDEATDYVRGWVHAMAAELLAARARIAAMRSLAEHWTTQSNDYDEDTEQQISDGWALKVLLSTPELFDLDELPARTLRLRREADAAARGVEFNEADYDEDFHAYINPNEDDE